MGYWRGHSVLYATTLFANQRSLRFLLKYGEARCGEWSELFLHLLLAQGIEVDLNNDTCAIACETTKQNIIKRYDIDFYPYKSDILKYRQYGLPEEFTVAKATFVKNKQNFNEYIKEGGSAAQGNKNAQSSFGDHIWVYFRNKLFLTPLTENLIQKKIVISNIIAKII